VKPILITGSTGYVGGRLVPRLLKSGHRVRVMGRSLSKLRCRPWASHEHVEAVQADIMDPDALNKAVQGCRAVYYLVHSMNPRHTDFAKADREAAENMARTAAEGGVERIIYLGGLGGPDDTSLSEHLRSRLEVANILQSGPVPTTFLRAAVILGSGGASFEMIRYLVDRLPVMITPRWVHTKCQPIAIRNVLTYLEGCLDHDETTGGTFDIGGPDILTYQELMEIYAEEAGLHRRWIIPVPVLTPGLSAYWIRWITPLPSSIARPLIEGLRTPVVCRENRIREILPQPLLSCRQTIRLALRKVAQHEVETCWADAGPVQEPEWTTCGDADYAGGTILECGYRVVLKASAHEVWRPIQRIGGKTGWYFADLMWRVRGALDRLVGGVGMRHGRRDSPMLYVGDALDFWRVLDAQPSGQLRLLSEMRLPGEAILEFQVNRLDGDRVELRQLSRFLPRGLGGLLYWYTMYPFHQWVFKGMLKGIARAVGRPIIRGPERFAPRLAHVCRIR